MATIVVCEDNPDIREMIVFILEGEGYKILPTHQGQGVLDFLKGEEAHLILLDLRIPDMDGYEVLSAVRSTYGEQAPPVVILSAKTAPEDRALAFSLGASDFVEKPFTVDGLLDAVKKNITPKAAD
jgi:DNA-binding response OmpR family regulator